LEAVEEALHAGQEKVLTDPHEEHAKHAAHINAALGQGRDDLGDTVKLAGWEDIDVQPPVGGLLALLGELGGHYC